MSFLSSTNLPFGWWTLTNRRPTNSLMELLFPELKAHYQRMLNSQNLTWYDSNVRPIGLGMKLRLELRFFANNKCSSLNYFMNSRWHYRCATCDQMFRQGDHYFSNYQVFAYVNSLMPAANGRWLMANDMNILLPYCRNGSAGSDFNRRSLGYEPSELKQTSLPRYSCFANVLTPLCIKHAAALGLS